MGFPGGSDGKESVCNAGDLGLIPASVRPPGEENGNPIQYSCLEKSMDKGAWRATVHVVAKESDMTVTKQQQWWQMSARLIMEIIVQYIQISNHCIIHLKLI